MEIENKTPDTNNLVTKTNFNTMVTETKIRLKRLNLIQKIEKMKLKYHGVANFKKKTDLG